MNLTFRSGNIADAEACGDICFQAFRAISEQHNFPPDFPAPEIAHGLLSMTLSLPHVYSVVAEIDGRVVGSNFLWEDTAIAGVGPITIDPIVQNSSIGRQLMQKVLDYAQEKKFAGVRLVQAAFNNRSLSLYTKLGFDVQEPLAHIQGPNLGLEVPGHSVRAATEGDLAACNQLCRNVHGHDRAMDLAGAVQRGTAMVVEHDGRISGYSTGINFFGHAVTENNEDLKALLGAADTLAQPGFLLPTRNSAMFRWCLEHGLRVVQPLTLMSMGLYKQPEGAFLPSILY